MAQIWCRIYTPLCQTKVQTRPSLPQLQALLRKAPGPPPPRILLIRAVQVFPITLLARRRHDKGNKERTGKFHILTSPTFFQNLPSPHIKTIFCKKTSKYKIWHHCSCPVCMSAKTWGRFGAEITIVGNCTLRNFLVWVFCLERSLYLWQQMWM